MPAQKLSKPGLESELELKPRYEAPKYRPANKLEGKGALVTGGDSGIGRAVAVMYARECADVAITALPEGRRCLVLQGDLTEKAFCVDAVERTVAELGQLDILVSNAGYQNRKAC